MNFPVFRTRVPLSVGSWVEDGCVQQVVKTSSSRRTGAASVELAVVLPLLVLLVLGTIEAARGVAVSHALQEASQAGCRIYSVGGTTQEQAKAIIDATMENAGITSHQIVFDPDEKSKVDKSMEEVTVSVSIPYSEISWLPPQFLSDSVLEGRTVFPADLEASDGGDTDGYRVMDDDNDLDGIVRDDDDD